MDNVEYTRGARPANLFEINNVSRYVSQSLKGFATATTPHCIASMRKFTVYNKAPSAVKILQRTTGKGGDIELPSAALDMVPLDYDSDYFVAAVQSGAVLLLRCVENPDGSISAAVVETVEIANVVRVACTQRNGTQHSTNEPTVGKIIIAATSTGALFTINAHGPNPTAEAAGDAGAAPQWISAGAGVVAVARGNKVSLFTADRMTGPALLAKPWYPHGDDSNAVVDFVHVARSTEGPLTVFTSSGSEVRLWTIVKNGITLHQNVRLQGVPAGTLKAVDPNDEFLVVADKPTGSTLVLEFAKKGVPMVERITEWSLGEEVVSLSGALRKVGQPGAESTKTEFAVVSRLATGVARAVFDAVRLLGPGNVEAIATASVPTPPTASSAPATQNESVKKWFANAAPVSQAAVAPAGFTHITSTTGGSTTTRSSVDARAAAEALSDLQAKYAQVLAQFDTAIVNLERQAGDSLSVLRAGSAGAIAIGEASGRQFAASLTNAGASAPAESSAYVINQDVLSAFTQAITDAATITVQQALAAGLKHHAGNAADRAAAIVANASNADREAIVLPKVTQLPSVQGLGELVDKAQAQLNELFRRQKEQDNAKYKALVRKEQEKALKVSSDLKKFWGDLAAEIAGLKQDLSSVSSLAPGGAAAAAAATDPAESEESLYNDAIRLAEAGQWSSALFKAVNVGKLSVLNRFLETDLIKANSAEITNSSHITVPLFVSIAQQLTSDMKDSVGLIPTRVYWLHQFTLAFDELLSQDAGGKHAKHVEAARVDIANVMDALQVADGAKGSLDRATKRNIGVVRKALAPHGL